MHFARCLSSIPRRLCIGIFDEVRNESTIEDAVSSEGISCIVGTDSLRRIRGDCFVFYMYNVSFSNQ
jgi:hypothetical protein